MVVKENRGQIYAKHLALYWEQAVARFVVDGDMRKVKIEVAVGALGEPNGSRNIEWQDATGDAAFKIRRRIEEIREFGDAAKSKHDEIKAEWNWCVSTLCEGHADSEEV